MQAALCRFGQGEGYHPAVAKRDGERRRRAGDARRRQASVHGHARRRHAHRAGSLGQSRRRHQPRAHGFEFEHHVQRHVRRAGHRERATGDGDGEGSTAASAGASASGKRRRVSTAAASRSAAPRFRPRARSRTRVAASRREQRSSTLVRRHGCRLATTRTAVCASGHERLRATTAPRFGFPRHASGHEEHGAAAGHGSSVHVVPGHPIGVPSPRHDQRLLDFD